MHAKIVSVVLTQAWISDRDEFSALAPAAGSIGVHLRGENGQAIAIYL
jgi:hypothetical protein